MDIEILKLLEDLNNDNQLTEDVGDVLKDQKESYLIVSKDGAKVLVSFYKSEKLTTSWTKIKNVTSYNQIRFLSADDAQKFNDKYNLEGNVVKDKRSYDLIRINLDPNIETYLDKAWLFKVKLLQGPLGLKILKAAGLENVKFYSEDIIYKIKELFNMFNSKKTIFNLKSIDVYPYKKIKNYLGFENISQLESYKNNIINVEKVTLFFEGILKNFTISLYIDIYNENGKLDTINRFNSYVVGNSYNLSNNRDDGYYIISGSEKEIESKTSSIPNITTLISIGDFLFDNLKRYINYEYYVEDLKKLGAKKLSSIKDNSYIKYFYLKNVTFIVKFKENFWEIASPSLHGFSIQKDSNSFSIEYPLIDDNSYFNLQNKLDNKLIEVGKEAKNTAISNLNGFLSEISSYCIEEENQIINKDETNKNLNGQFFSIGQDLLDLAEANLKLEE